MCTLSSICSYRWLHAKSPDGVRGPHGDQSSHVCRVPRTLSCQGAAVEYQHIVVCSSSGEGQTEQSVLKKRRYNAADDTTTSVICKEQAMCLRLGNQILIIPCLAGDVVVEMFCR